MGYKVELKDFNDLPKTGTVADILCVVSEQGKDENGSIVESTLYYWHPDANMWADDDGDVCKLSQVKGWFWIYQGGE